jgi:hypothetical protein
VWHARTSSRAHACLCHRAVYASIPTPKRPVVAGVPQAATFDHNAGPFICGVIAETGPDGLAKAYHICPCFDVDVGFTGVYRRVNLSDPPRDKQP